MVIDETPTVDLHLSFNITPKRGPYRAGKAPTYSIQKARELFSVQARDISIQSRKRIEAMVLNLSLR
ncbi:hypothetical protein D3C74_345140 [compost metagenome]